ncbi:hypothetical protein CDD80_2817 [Ophiocordyceps camponoti-rufipedis]|uniref:Rho-GAP domain-containing protein n=1 Tax=Ophiocordyceps camponoti-rufipedis TaxID=2004952 RepID=A0A2C5Z4X2_9HYPO|nr:hypothetical protein CDD80_2817 [Ophiocordyceps camponoti-rufipedis]
MAEPRRLAASNSTQNLHANYGTANQRLPPSASSASLAFPQSASMHSLLAQASRVRSSGTWTTSSGELGLLSDTDEVEDRAIFVHEYNRLAKKHGVRLLVVDDFSSDEQPGHDVVKSPERRGWLHRLLHPNNDQGTAVPQTAPPPCQLQLRRKRSVSDLAHMIRSRLEPPRVVCIQDMVRLSGKSMLYLPQDYAPCSLVLPTCVRATAQHLAQNAATRGLFRIPGSVKVVTALFDHYCCPEPGGVTIAGTVHSANLPLHMALSVHDVASTFKKLLSVLPGGILGSLSLFDALVAIHSQLNGEPEYPRTKQTKVRARLIALAIGTVKSQFRRELICAVMGLLSLIGRVAEVTPREDADGRPLPTANLMGYSALGIVFGPLLVGDLLDQYAMKLAIPTTGLLLLPFSPQKLRRERRKVRADGMRASPPTVNKIMVANDIAEMLIANWRDVVRQMRSLGAHHCKDSSLVHARCNSLAPSASEPFAIKMPRDLDAMPKGSGKTKDEDGPEPDTPTMALKRRRSRPANVKAPPKLLHKVSIQTLSPMIEERSTEEVPTTLEAVSEQDKKKATDENPRGEQEALPDAAVQPGHDRGQTEASVSSQSRVLLDCVPPRLSSRLKRSQDGSEMQTNMSYSTGGDLGEPTPDATQRLKNRRQARTLNKMDPDNGLRNSIGSTPDHLYPPTDGRSRPCNARTESEVDRSQAAVGLQRGLPPSKCADDADRRESEVAEPPLGLDRGQAFPSNEAKSPAPGSKPFRKRPVRFIVRSPSHSDSSDRLSKKGSVKAMAAMFEGQGLNLAKMACAHLEDADDGGLAQDHDISPCPCGQQARGNRCASDGLTPFLQDQAARLTSFRDRAATFESPCRHVVARHSLPVLAPCPFADLRADHNATSGDDVDELRSHCRQHGKLTRSLSMPPLGCQALDEAAALDPPTRITEPCRSKISLFCQIHNLKSKLSLREEEAAHLRSRLETQEETEVGALSEQLRAARRDTSRWRERAESAERRIRAFERFATRVRALKESMAASRLDGDMAGVDGVRRRLDDEGQGGAAMGGDGAGSRRASFGRLTLGAEQMWAAVEELLRAEDEGRCGPGKPLRSSGGDMR